ncbi:LysR family transcriptional regulator [Oculatella sp. FACHB-28]|uniref:LysR family transcriptional regulator n=1 Tax=Cyanophyceae TaxID=3028117 RepID=UPI0016834908|nr:MULTISPECIES: LysR family transcriptional regulator [Cyanophyceae]MBD2058546.1 LysR family transcriptional regulator [Oculatella sp. FACHB-28]MBD2066566.1 LysR family transcriptional regulator [Leptolyngbya sp. FACHB-671]
MRTGNLDGIKLSQLRALVAVAEVSNFSEAALRLEVSQSAISHAIAALEESLGVVLFSRGRHGARLTPIGERVKDHAEDMLKLLDVIGKEVNLTKGLKGGQVRVGVFRSVATRLLPEVIVRLKHYFPDITTTPIEYRDDDRVEQALREGRVDVGFTCMPITDGFEGWELMRDEYVVLLPPKLQRPETPLTWEELATYPMIMTSGQSKLDYCSVLTRQHFAELGQPINIAYDIQEDSTSVGMVERGLGVTVLPRLATEPLPPEIQVCSLPVPLYRHIQVVMLADALHSPAVYAFLDTLKELYPPELQATPISSERRQKVSRAIA